MIHPKQIKYFPLTEVLTFSLFISAAVVVLYSSKSNLFLLVPIVPFIYIITMGRATIVKIDHDKLKITSLSIFMKSRQIDLPLAVKIELHQIFEHETDVTYGGSFFAFDKYYELQYKNADGKIFKTYFSINNKTKEQEIISTITSFLPRY